MQPKTRGSKLRLSGENLARSEVRKAEAQLTARFGRGWFGQVHRVTPFLHLLHASQLLLKRVFLWARFHLTRSGEICPAVWHHSPATLKAVEDRPTPRLSLKSVKGAGRYAKRNDAELSYCVNAQLPDDATAPKGIG